MITHAHKRHIVNTCDFESAPSLSEILVSTSPFPNIWFPQGLTHYRLHTLHILTSAILHIKNGYTPVMIIQVITKDFVHATFMFDTQHVSHCDTEGSKKGGKPIYRCQTSKSVLEIHRKRCNVLIQYIWTHLRSKAFQKAMHYWESSWYTIHHF